MLMPITIQWSPSSGWRNCKQNTLQSFISKPDYLQKSCEITFGFHNVWWLFLCRLNDYLKKNKDQQIMTIIFDLQTRAAANDYIHKLVVFYHR